jgi:hypothetical protein
MGSRETLISRSKPGKGKRSLTGQTDFVALGRDLVDCVETGVYILRKN